MIDSLVLPLAAGMPFPAAATVVTATPAETEFAAVLAVLLGGAPVAATVEEPARSTLPDMAAAPDIASADGDDATTAGDRPAADSLPAPPGAPVVSWLPMVAAPPRAEPAANASMREDALAPAAVPANPASRPTTGAALPQSPPAGPGPAATGQRGGANGETTPPVIADGSAEPPPAARRSSPVPGGAAVASIATTAEQDTAATPHRADAAMATLPPTPRQSTARPGAPEPAKHAIDAMPSPAPRDGDDPAIPGDEAVAPRPYAPRPFAPRMSETARPPNDRDPSPPVTATAEPRDPTPPVPAPPPLDPTTPAPTSAADPPAPSRPSPAPPIRQVAQIAVTAATEGMDGSTLSVALEPGALGRVEISIERSAEATQVRVLAERPETLVLLQRDARELDRMLGQAGIGAEGRALSFGLSGGGAGGNGGGHQPGDHPSHRAGTLAEIAALAGSAAPRAPLGLIDIAV